MHDDMTAILKCYTEEAVSKSRKAKGPGRKHRRNNENEKQNEIATNTSAPVKLESEEDSKDNATGLLSALSDDQLLKELARRKTCTGHVHISSDSTRAVLVSAKHGDLLFSFQVFSSDMFHFILRH